MHPMNSLMLTQLRPIKLRAVSGQRLRYLKNGSQMKAPNTLGGYIQLVQGLVINY